MRNRSTDEEMNRGAMDEIRDRGGSGRGNRWEGSTFDVRPTAGDAGWAEGPHNVRRGPPPDRGMREWNRSDWEGGSPAEVDTSFARSRMQEAFRGKGPKNYVRSDERIREDVFEVLTYQNELDASDVEVQVAQGEVTLTGMVRSREEKRAAEDLVHGVRGVRDVHNQLRIQRGEAAGTQRNPEPDANADGSRADRGR